MYLIGEEIYKKFSGDDVEIKIPKNLLEILMKQVSKHYDILNEETEILNNFAVSENINNTEMILTKLFILTAEPYDRKEVILSITTAEFLILRDIAFCNYTLIHLKTKMNFHFIKLYKEFFEQLENIYEKLDSKEVNAYWDFIKNS